MEKNKIWFTSDTHYNHTNIASPNCSRWDSGYRNFDSLAHHNQSIVDNINTVVAENDVLYHLGDWSFGGIHSIWDFRKQIACKNIHLILGNHDCFDVGTTEILTEKGWMKYNEWNIFKPKIASFNINKKVIEFSKPLNKYYSCYTGLMYNLKNRHLDIYCTPNHRIFSKRKSINNSKFSLSEIKNIPKKSIPLVFINAGITENKDLSVADSLIALTAWILADGSVKESVYGTSFCLYQSEGKHKIIEKLLNELNIPFNSKKRNRNISRVNGRQLKKLSKPCFEYYINQGSILEQYIISKYTFPDWLYKLSKRQFDIFLENYVLADGNKHKQNPYTSWIIYGTEKCLSQLQALCVQNGHRSVLNKYRNKQYRLYITKDCNTSEVSRYSDNLEISNYKGFIFCFKTQNDTLIIRRNGKVCIVGNSHIDVNKILPNVTSIEPYGNEFKDEPQSIEEKNEDYPNYVGAQQLFSSVQHYKEIRVEKQRICLFHFAQRVWNKSHHGSWHLYGHSHGSIDNNWGKSIDVGLDSVYNMFGEYRPISYQEVKEIMEIREIKFLDHHNLKTN